METNRKNDSSQEQLITSWLNKYLFSNIFDQYEIVNDRQRQIDGIDIVVGDRNIDLKAQSSRKYLNNPRPTFSFEISFYNRAGQLMNGLFVSNKKTSEYALIWIPKAVVNEDGYLKDDESIEQLEIMFVSVEDIRKYVAKYHTARELLDMAQDMRLSGEDRVKINEDMHLTYTKNLFEQPVNLILKKSILLSIANAYYRVDKQHIERIK